MIQIEILIFEVFFVFYCYDIILKIISIFKILEISHISVNLFRADSIYVEGMLVKSATVFGFWEVGGVFYLYIVKG
jgi:hypothetical protein